MEAPIKELEKQFDQINFDKIMSNNQDEKRGKDKNMELTTNLSKADPEFNISKPDDSIDLGAQDIRQNQENVDVQFHASYLNRNSPFNDVILTDSHKNIELLEMQTQVYIHKENLNSNQNIDTNISQPLDLESSQIIRDKEIDTSVDGDLTVIKLSKLQTHTTLNKKVL